jgi:diguanylate cyclase (GGDEF)-like protein/PAS domain S-box-containing protein
LEKSLVFTNWQEKRGYFAKQQARFHRKETAMPRKPEDMQKIAARLLEQVHSAQALPEFLRRAAQAFDAPDGAIVLRDESDPSQGRVRHGIGLYAKTEGDPLSTELGAVGQAWQTGKVVVVDDYRVWSGRRNIPALARMTTAITAPLKVADEIIGVIQLAWNDEVYPLTPADIAAFEQFSLLASVALSNATLFAQYHREKAMTDAVFDSIPGLIYLLDETGYAVRWNHQLSEITGYSDEEICRRNCLEYFRGPDVALIQERFLKTLQEGNAIAEAEFYRKDESHFSVFLTSVKLMIQDKPHVAGIGIDVTERKQAVEALARSEEELRQHRTRLEALVEARSAEVIAANQELTAMNEEMAAMNTELRQANLQLGNEVELRQSKENEVLLREQQYRSATRLLTRPVEEAAPSLEAILRDALQLVKAPAGYIGLYNQAENHVWLSPVSGPLDFMSLNPRPADRGVLGHVVETGEAVSVEDYRTYARRIDDPLLERLTSLITVPLKHGDHLIGTLTAHWLDEPYPFSQEDVEVLKQYGDLAAAVLERADVQAQIMQKNELLQGLAETTKALLGELDLNVVLQEVLNKAIALTGIPHGFVQLFECNDNVGTIRAAYGRYSHQIGDSAKVEGGVYSEVVRTGKMVVIPDYARWPQRLTTPRQEGLSMGIQAPLIINGSLIGMIGLAAFGEPVSLEDDKLAAVEHLAGIAAIAVQNGLSHEEARTLAFKDVLTGLANRVSLNRWLEAEMQQAREYAAQGALFFIDMDDLKTVNDTFGHSLGDEVIIGAARHIREVVGAESFVARIGGDEFVIGLPGTADRMAVTILAEKLLQSLCHDYELSGQRIHMSASIGVTLYPKDGDTPDEILKNADSAMYAAKRNGRNCWSFYEPVLQTEAFEKMTLTNSLRRALDHEELLLHFQPLVRLPEKSIVGFEALLRWNSAEHGMVPPARFIPFAEQSGLIISLGYWVIIEACRFAQKLTEKGLDDLFVAVNISPRQLADINFIAMIRSAIHESGIRSDQLEIEITENVLIESMEESIKKLISLKEIGVRIALDDFGTGYSSLTYLRRLPVGTLKVDKSFIDDILEDRTQADLVGYIIDMAHTLNISVVAEGVESEEQAQKLHQYDCDCIQGYLFSRPVPAEAALALLK